MASVINYIVTHQTCLDTLKISNIIRLFNNAIYVYYVLQSVTERPDKIKKYAN